MCGRNIKHELWTFCFLCILLTWLLHIQLHFLSFYQKMKSNSIYIIHVRIDHYFSFRYKIKLMYIISMPPFALITIMISTLWVKAFKMPFHICSGVFNFRYLCFIFKSMWPSMHLILTSWKYPPMKNLQQIFFSALNEHKWWPINDQFWVYKLESLPNTQVFTLQIW